MRPGGRAGPLRQRPLLGGGGASAVQGQRPWARRPILRCAPATTPALPCSPAAFSCAGGEPRGSWSAQDDPPGAALMTWPWGGTPYGPASTSAVRPACRGRPPLLDLPETARKGYKARTNVMRGKMGTRPPRLRPGDTVGVAAPAAPFRGAVPPTRERAFWRGV